MITRGTIQKFYAAFAIALLAGIIDTIGQIPLPGASTDSCSLLNGQLKIVLKNGPLIAMKSKDLRPIFPGSPDTIKILSMNGFKMGKAATLRFYQTTIDKPIKKDGGLSIWKQIFLFTDQIPESSWLESGWKSLGRDRLYFVKMISGQKPEQYFEFAFFYLDNKLSMGVLQCPLKSSEDYKSKENESYMSFILN